MAKSSPVEFIREVREETAKVVWPSRREVMISTVMVLIMATAAALFFLGVDAILKYVIDKVLLGI